MTMNLRALLRVLVCVLSLVAISACDNRHGASPRELDEATMAVVNTARALHHEADVYESAGDFNAAAGAIQRVLALRIPSSVAEAEDIRVDAWGRLAEIALMADDPDRALAHANSGLQDSHHESVLRARLHVVRGRALRALAERAAANGDTTTADARRREALDALETSIAINQRVLNQLADGGIR
jgi:tetratricopeptide (TPR) repeat protein